MRQLKGTESDVFAVCGNSFGCLPEIRGSNIICKPNAGATIELDRQTGQVSIKGLVTNVRGLLTVISPVTQEVVVITEIILLI